MYSPDGTHLALLRQKPQLAFDETKDFATQQTAIREKLIELLGYRPQPVPLDPVVEAVTEHDTYTERRIVFNVEKDVQAVCMLCIPKLNKEKYPLVVVVQGHGTGMHVSMGRNLDGTVNENREGDRDNALQALERGYAALCLEQRGMGERRTDMVDNPNDGGYPRCHVTAMNALLIGRTLMGKGGIFNRAVGMVLGAFVFRLVYTIALRMNMPAYMLKLVSSTIVVIAIFLPYLKKQMPLMRRRMAGNRMGGN